MICRLKAENYNKTRYLYMTALLFLMCIRSLGIYAFLPRTLDVIFMSLIGICGFLVICYGLKTNQLVIDTKKDIYIVLFLMCFVISSILNIKYGIFQNIRLMIWTLINFFVLYIAGKDESKQEQESKLVIFQNIIVVSWLTFSLMSIITFIFKIDYMVQIGEHTFVRIGYVENRLFGIFSNPNGTSFVALISLIISLVHILENVHGALDKRLNLTNIVLQFIYIVLSNSRGTLVVFFSIVSIVCFFTFYKSSSLKKIHKIILGIVLTAIICVILFYVINFIRDILIYIVNSLFPAQTKEVRVLSHQRKDFVENNDISNLRFKIWSSAWEIFKTRWLFGTSPGNVLNYAKSVFPDGFISQRMYHSIHSVWIGMPLYTGICGAICIFSFFAKCALKMALHYIKNLNQKLSPNLKICFLIIFATWIYGLVELEILFVNSVCSFIFWTSLGFVRKNVDF